MKKKIIFAALAGAILSGCIVVPYGYEEAEERTCGKRLNEDGEIVESLVHRKLHLNFFAVGLLHNGFFDTSYFGYSRYALDTKDGRKNVWQIAHFPMLSSDVIDGGTPVPGSDRWILTKEKILSAREVDLRIILYSPNDGIVWDKTINKVYRQDPEPWRFGADGRTVVVNAVKGEIVLPFLPE